MPQKTHTLVKDPSINVRYLADYMASSEQARRTLLRGCKYRSGARMIQHIEAKAAVTNYIKLGANNPDELREKAQQILNKMTVDDFEESTNLHNANYIKRFADVSDLTELNGSEKESAGKPANFDVNGVSVRFDPILTLTRTTRTNKLKRGVIMLRYLKGKALPETTAGFQSSAALGLLRMQHGDDSKEPDGGMCLTLDCHSGVFHPAPSKANYLFKEMQAACSSIAERWAAIEPPKGAVF